MGLVIRPRLSHFEPNADVFVNDGTATAVVTVEVAGADPESLRIEIDDERGLLISGRRREPDRSRAGSFAQKEIAYGDFAKRVHLPIAVECDGATATYADGVLAITLTLAPTAYRPTSRTEIHMIVKRIPW